MFLEKIPFIQKVMSSINWHQYKQSIILGVVLGVIALLALHLTLG